MEVQASKYGNKEINTVAQAIIHGYKIMSGKGACTEIMHDVLDLNDSFTEDVLY